MIHGLIFGGWVFWDVLKKIMKEIVDFDTTDMLRWQNKTNEQDPQWNVCLYQELH